MGGKVDNMFIDEFGSNIDKARALNNSPWMVGKHAVILQEYDEALKPYDVCFVRMEMWVSILNLPFSWMNERRGRRAAGLISEVMKMDVDHDGKTSGLFLRARAAVEIEKPLRRGVMLKTNSKGNPEWFDVQYEKLPFFCFSCGMLGHSEIVCPRLMPRNALGKLPYDLKFRAPEDKREKNQSFAQAASESWKFCGQGKG
jgi:hypothetical protein